MNKLHFTDDGVSGTIFDRKGFQTMIAEVEARAVATIIVKDMSRFWRGYLKVGLNTEMVFPFLSARFISLCGGATGSINIACKSLIHDCIAGTSPAK